jgi:hypothetical protein
MTQPELVKKYISEFGFIIPAKNIGRSYGGGFFGAELSRVCRELRKKGVLDSRPEGKYEKFFYRLVSKPREEVRYFAPMNTYKINGEYINAINGISPFAPKEKNKKELKEVEQKDRGLGIF